MSVHYTNALMVDDEDYQSEEKEVGVCDYTRDVQGCTILSSPPVMGDIEGCTILPTAPKF